MEKKLFIASLLIDGTGQPPLKDPYILVEDGFIREIGSGRPPDPLRETAELIEMPGSYIIPGIIDAHVHLALGLPTPESKGTERDPVRLAMVALKNALIALVAGVTTVADCGSRFGVPLQVRDSIAKGEVPGCRIWACGVHLTTTCGHGYDIADGGLDGIDELRQGVRRTIWNGADFIKIMASGGSGTPIANRRRAQYSAAEMRAAVEDAHRLNRRVHCHAQATEALRNCIEAGVDVLEHCNWLGAEEGTIEYDHDASLLAGKKGLFAGMNIGAAFGPLIRRDGAAQDWGKITRWDLMRRMQEAGVTIFLDSDATDTVEKPLDALPKDMPRMVEEGRATAMEVIQMTTLIPAQAMGVADRLGSVEKGKLADLVFLAKNPLVDMSALRSPLVVVKEGKIVARDGKIVF